MSTKFPELSYANPGDPWLRRVTIHTMERLSGRGYFEPIYDDWRTNVVHSSATPMGDMLKLIDVKLKIAQGTFPPKLEPGRPLIMIGNHPYGILDGVAALALAEQLGRPYKVLINKDLTKVPEVQPYSLPVDFAETREAQTANIRTRNEALRLLREGTTIVVFPAGGVATAPTPFGKAVDLPWKSFTARMIQSARASVLPIYFEGQCGPLFHFVSRYSLTLRLSLLIAEFRKLVGTTLSVRVGDVIPFEALEHGDDRKALMVELYERVHRLSGVEFHEEQRKVWEDRKLGSY